MGCPYCYHPDIAKEGKPMSWIREEDVGLSNVIKGMSINPRAMAAVYNLGRAISFGASALTRVQEEAIATAVSVANKCRY